MKISSWKIPFMAVVALFVHSTAWADLSVRSLDAARSSHSPEYGPGSEAFTQAVSFSLLQTDSRIKLPGAGKFTLDAGFQMFDADDKNLYTFTDNQHSPAAFQTLLFKIGVGLPLGLAINLGLSQVISEHMLTGMNASMSYQLLDFSTWVYTDLVPAVTLNLSALRTMSEPALYSFTTQTNLGVYHRFSGSQFAYAFRFNYSMLTATASAITKEFIQHGFVSHVPILPDISLQTEIYFPTMTGTVLVGYQF